jgi:hypothetical protein
MSITLALFIEFCYTDSVLSSIELASYRNQGEAAMTAKTPTRKPVTVEIADAPVVAQIAQEADTTAPALTDLIARKRALDEQIKAAKAAMPQVSKLERVIAKQTVDNGKWLVIHLRNRVAARVKAGQPMQDAVDAVLAQYRALLLPPTEA